MDGKNLLRRDLGGGLFLHFYEVENGCGGYHPVNMRLFCSGGSHGRVTLVKELTNSQGRFLSFPGVTSGPWEQKLVGTFQPQVDFVASIGPFRDSLACFRWMVQPDGFYYTDEDGFGAEDDEEIWLFALMDDTGNFITPFSDSPPPPPSSHDF